MGAKWTAERHEKMKATWAAKRAARSSGRAPSPRQKITLRGSPLSKSISLALEAQKLVDRIGWDLARKLASRIDAAAA